MTWKGKFENNSLNRSQKSIANKTTTGVKKYHFISFLVQQKINLPIAKYG